ncbi:MAG TPA: cytochrome c oxidase subunit 3 [Kofleriaceae bacterium]|nr:cytochrome c oxidase subunit 3 [Kofleriaceae bacterium]
MSTAHDAHDAHDEHHVDHGSPFIQHHYDDAQHQFDSGKFGIWLFLAQEVLFFSALFVAYVLYRVHHGEIYSYAHKWLDVKYGAINTAVLIFSSLTAAWAVRCAQLNQRRGLIACIVITLMCACTFLGIKYIEYSHKVHEHILFGRFFDPCVSPGNVEMLTKRNECPGSKTTIEWSLDADGELALLDGKANKGCIEGSTIDQDPHEPGVQADCAVDEVLRHQVEKKDPKTGAVVKDANGHIQYDWADVTSKSITTQCAEHLPWEHEAPQTFPCWRVAYQPAVCPDLTDADKRSHGAASRPQYAVLVEFGDSLERSSDDASSSIAEHDFGEHARGVTGDLGIVIDAKCKAAPKAPPPPVDMFAEQPQAGFQLGQRAIHPVHIPTVEEEHELEAAGPPPEHTNLFLTIYFAMTGLHGIHVLFGVFVFLWLLIRAIKGQFTPDYFGPIDYAALYWHIVDLIWIFLFPLLYLIH